MPGSGVKFEVEEPQDWEKFERLPDKISDVLLDTDRLFDEAIHPHMLDFVKRVYATQGEAAGSRWPDYSAEPGYAWYKAAAMDVDAPSELPVGQNRPGGLMRWADSAEWGEEWLYPSLTQKSDPRHVWEKQGFDAIFGTSVDHAHEAAEEHTTGPMGEPSPPRPILNLTSRERKKLRLQIAAYYIDRLRGIGLPIESDTSTIARFAGLT